MTALFSCGWSGMSIIEDLDHSIVDRFLVTPVHRSAIIGGLTIYQMVSLLIQAAIIGGLALLLGAHFDGGLLGYGALTVCALLLGAAIASFSDATALILRQRESVIGINTLMTLPLTFLSAAFLPLALAPEWIQTVARFNPVNWAVEAGREALLATPDWSFILPAHRRARDPRAAHDGVGDPDVPLVPAVHLGPRDPTAGRRRDRPSTATRSERGPGFPQSWRCEPRGMRVPSLFRRSDRAEVRAAAAARRLGTANRGGTPGVGHRPTIGTRRRRQRPVRHASAGRRARQSPSVKPSSPA